MNPSDNWLEEAEASQDARDDHPTQDGYTTQDIPEPGTSHPARIAADEQATPSAQDEEKPLNAQQMRFIDEYRKSGERNAAAAYLRAGYDCTSMSTASAAASRLLRQVNVKTELKRRRDEDRRLARISEEKFKAEIMRRFMARPADYIDPETGELRAGLSSDDLAAISDIEVKTEYTLTGKIVTIRPKTESRAKYAELAMRLNGWGQSDVNVNVNTPQPVCDDIPDISLDALPGLLANLPPDVLGSLAATAQSMQTSAREQEAENAEENRDSEAQKG